MDQTGKDLLSLMFKEGEEVCISPNKYGYCSIPLEKALEDRVTLISTKLRDGTPIEECRETYDGEALQLVALNPIKGWRADASCTAFRSFLVELDDGPLRSQLEYVKVSGIPYSACIFSGSKSLHFLITLEDDLTDKKTYDHAIQWILNILTKADQATKNPSRSIRVPGAIRGDRRQKLVEIHGKVPNGDLYGWLKLHPHKKPKIVEKRQRDGSQRLPDMPFWMTKALKEGLSPDKGRNVQWFSMAVELYLHGYEEEDVIEVLEDYFVEERDFKRREWLTSIKSACKYVLEKK